jgi:competence protein ComEA
MAACVAGVSPRPLYAWQSKPAASTAKPSPAKSAVLVDINSATEAQLKELPGIGDAYAAKIVQNRPYRVKTDLERKNVVPHATYEKVKDRIIARQKAAAK